MGNFQVLRVSVRKFNLHKLGSMVITITTSHLELRPQLVFTQHLSQVDLAVIMFGVFITLLIMIGNKYHNMAKICKIYIYIYIDYIMLYISCMLLWALSLKQVLKMGFDMLRAEAYSAKYASAFYGRGSSRSCGSKGPVKGPFVG